MKDPKGIAIPDPDMKLKLKHFSPLLLLCAAIVWGFAFTAQKAADALPAFTINAIRNMLGAIMLIPLILLFDRASRNGRKLFSKRGVDITKYEWLAGFVCGTALFLAAYSQQFGISGTGAGKASFISALYVVFVPILSLFFRKRSPYNVWAGVVLAVIGFYFLCIHSDFTIVPADLIVLLAAMLYAVQILAIGHFSPRCDSVRLSCLQFFFASLLSFVAALIFEQPFDGALILENALPLLYLGVFSCGVGYTCQTLGQKYTPPAVASVLMSLESVFGVLGATIVLHDVMTVREYIGCLIVLLGVLLAQADPIALLRKAIRKRRVQSAQTGKSSIAPSNRLSAEERKPTFPAEYPTDFAVRRAAHEAPGQTADFAEELQPKLPGERASGDVPESDPSL